MDNIYNQAPDQLNMKLAKYFGFPLAVLSNFECLSTPNQLLNRPVKVCFYLENHSHRSRFPVSRASNHDDQPVLTMSLDLRNLEQKIPSGLEIYEPCLELRHCDLAAISDTAPSTK